MKTSLNIKSISARAVVVPMRRPLQASTGAVSAAGAGLGMKWNEKAVRKYAA